MNYAIRNAAFVTLSMILLFGCKEQSTPSGVPKVSPQANTPLALQSLVTGYFSPQSDKTSHRYSISTVVGETYSADLNYTDGKDNPNTELYFRVEKLDGTLIFAPKSVVANTAKYFEFIPTSTEVIVVVFPYQERIDGAYKGYSLTVYPSSSNGLVRDNNLEPNHTPSTAAPLDFQSPIFSALEGTGDHMDFYRVATDSNKTYTAEVTFTEGTSTGSFNQLRLRVDSNDGTILLPEQDIAWRNTRYFEFSTKDDAPITVKLFPYSVAEYRRFQYRLTLLPSVDNGLIHDSLSLEPNNTPSTAYPIFLAQTIVSELTAVELPDAPTGTEDHEDNFSVPVLAGQVYSLNLSSLISPATGAYKELRVSVTSSLGSILIAETTVSYGGTGTYDFVPLQDGTAIIRIFSHKNFDSAYYKYSFTVTGL